MNIRQFHRGTSYQNVHVQNGHEETSNNKTYWQEGRQNSAQ